MRRRATAVPDPVTDVYPLGWDDSSAEESLASLVREGEAMSGAGAGHGYRVALIARHFARRLLDAQAPDLDLLELAARTHEVGRVFRPMGTLLAQAEQAAAVLNASGAPYAAVQLLQLKETAADLRHLAGARLAGLALALSVADRLDHAVTEEARKGTPPRQAVETATQELAGDAAWVECTAKDAGMSELLPLLVTMISNSNPQL